MAHETTPYSVLRVPEEASPEEIKQAYRKLVKLWHPDLHPDDMSAEKRMAEINEAYTVLSDPAQKRKLDDKLAQSRAAERKKQEEAQRKAEREKAAAAAAAAARAAAAVNAQKPSNQSASPSAKNRPSYRDPDQFPRTSGSGSADSSYIDFTKPEEPQSPFVVSGDNGPAGYHSNEESEDAPVPAKKASRGATDVLTPGEKGMESFSVALCVFFPLIIPIVRKHLKESLQLYPDSPHYQDCMASLRIVSVFALPLWAFLVFLILKAIFKF
ncbi:MAG: J domain-containing protein [Clostridiales bacterium]|nr:J domain-containing protein [Clostridiales bacterium]